MAAAAIAFRRTESGCTRVLAAEGSLGSAAVGSVSGRGETKVYGTWEAEANNNDAAHLRMSAQAAQSRPSCTMYIASPATPCPSVGLPSPSLRSDAAANCAVNVFQRLSRCCTTDHKARLQPPTLSRAPNTNITGLPFRAFTSRVCSRALSPSAKSSRSMMRRAGRRVPEV